MELIDTHCHIDFYQYDADRAAVLGRAEAADVRRIIIPGVDAASIQRARDLLEIYPNLFMAVGIHPNSTANWDGSMLDDLQTWASAQRVVAVGEIGLDYHWDKSPKADQRRAFEDQLALAAELGLPIIIHSREAGEDVLPILENWVKGLPSDLAARPGVLHSFGGDEAQAERALEAGFYLGFTGPVTYKNAEMLRRIAAAVPDDKILIETDGPFLTPLPHRGKRNEPAYVRLVAERIAALRGLNLDDFAALSTANAERLFRLGA